MMPSFFKTPDHTLQTNLKYLKYINILYGLTFFVPYLALYLQDKLLSLSLVAMIFTIETFCKIIFEFPSGFISDIFGRRKTLILAALLRIISFAILLIAPSTIFFILFAILSAAAQCLRSRTDESLIYETCHELKQDNIYQREIGRYFSLYTIGATISAFVAGLLATISIEFTIWASFIPSSLVVYISMLLVEPHYHQTESHDLKKHLNTLKNNLLKSAKLKYILIFNSLLVAIFTILNKFNSVFFEFKNIDISQIAYFIALFYLLNSSGYRLSHKLSKRFSSFKTLNFSIITLSFAVLLSTIFTSHLAIFIFLTSGFFFAISAPILSEIINRNADSTIRVSTHSVTNLLINLFVFILTTSLTLSANFLNINQLFLILSLIPLAILITCNKNINKIVKQSKLD